MVLSVDMAKGTLTAYRFLTVKMITDNNRLPLAFRAVFYCAVLVECCCRCRLLAAVLVAQSLNFANDEMCLQQAISGDFF